MRNSSQHHKLAAASVACFLLMVWIDYATGRELVVSAAYLIPVTLCAWYLGTTSVWLMAVAGGLATGVMGAVEGHVYSHFVFHYWNSISCFLVSLVTGLLLRRVKLMLEQRRLTNDELRQALENLTTSTEEIRKLQGGLQVVCAWTHQIKVGDEWMPPDEFLTRHLHLQLTHGMSPEACQKVRAEIEALTMRADGVASMPATAPSR